MNTGLDVPCPESDIVAALRAFAAGNDERAFRAVVADRLGLVLGTARRQLGDETAAREVAQSVFATLARKAARVARHPQPSAWLHHCTLIECRRYRRRELLRHHRMKVVTDHLRLQQGREIWTEVLPLLDRAIEALPASDRRLILLRFFDRRGFREIGSMIGQSDDTAQKQTSRAVEKLARWLARHGVTVSAAAVSAGLAEAIAIPVTPALAASLSSGALTAAVPPALLSSLSTQIHRVMHTKSKATLVAGAAVALTTLLWQSLEIRSLRRALAQKGSTGAYERPRPPSNPADGLRRSRIAAAGPAGAAVASDAASRESWELALLEPDPLQRAQKISALLARLDTALAPDIDTLFGRLAESGRSFTHERTLFLRAWGRLDGSAVLAHLSRGGSPDASPERLAALAGWASQDPASAKSWLESVAADDARTALAYGLLDGWALLDFAGAAAYTLSLPRSDTREQIRRLLFERCLAAGDIPAAQQWFANLPDDTHNELFKQRTLNDIVSTMLLRDPSAAARWITELAGASSLSAEAISKTAAKLAESAPVESLRWLESLESRGAAPTGTGFAETMHAWSRTDPEAAAAWLGERPDHPAFDGMAAAHARALSARDIPGAVAWANSIADPDTRRQGLIDLARSVTQAQGKIGREALAEAGVAEDIIDASVQTASRALLSRWIDQKIGTEAQSALISREWALARDATLYDSLTNHALVYANTATAADHASLLSLGPHPPGFASRNCASCHSSR